MATELHAEFPLLWEQAQAFDFAERLGGCSDPLLAEIDRAMHELCLARSNVREASLMDSAARTESGLAGTAAADHMEGAEAGFAPGGVQDARPLPRLPEEEA